MNTIVDFYHWLTPSVPFEFILHRSADECAISLACKAGTRYGMFFRRLQVDVSPQSDRTHTFLLKPQDVTYLQVEAHGTISALADDYAQIEGIARVRPTLMTLILAVFFAVLFSIIAVTLGAPLITANLSPATLIGVSMVAVVLIVQAVFQIWSQKLVMTTYADMVLGLLVRSL